MNEELRRAAKIMVIRHAEKPTDEAPRLRKTYPAGSVNHNGRWGPPIQI